MITRQINWGGGVETAKNRTQFFIFFSLVLARLTEGRNRGNELTWGRYTLGCFWRFSGYRFPFLKRFYGEKRGESREWREWYFIKHQAFTSQNRSGQHPVPPIEIEATHQALHHQASTWPFSDGPLCIFRPCSVLHNVYRVDLWGKRKSWDNRT